VKLSQSEWVEIKDIEKVAIINGVEETYCFSDGIGMIAPSYMKKLCGGPDNPCAVQFRFGGYKGMLCIYPPLDDLDIWPFEWELIRPTNFDGTKPKIVFRKSQRKFESGRTYNWILEILSHSYVNLKILLI
jgi:hypothetical protein